jgi:flagellar assembly factor FliW
VNISHGAAAPLTAPATPESLPPERYRVRSRFADVDVSARNVIAFPDGVPGYEGTRAFVLIDLPDVAPLKVLHPIDGDDPCFLVVDPTVVLPTFRCDLGPADRLRLGGADERSLVWLVTVIVEDTGEVAVNLRAPIVIDPVRMTGRQVMPNACAYPLRYVIPPLV